MSKPVISKNEDGYLEVTHVRVTERKSVHKRRTPTRLKVYQMTHEWEGATLADLDELWDNASKEDLKEVRGK